jgi:hypothetical protein
VFIVGEQHNICTTGTAEHVLHVQKVATIQHKTFPREVDQPWLDQRVYFLQKCSAKVRSEYFDFQALLPADLHFVFSRSSNSDINYLGHH